MKKVLLCSLLKPADDVRMYQKLAISFPDMDSRSFVFVGRHRNGTWPDRTGFRFLPAFDGKSSLSYRFSAILKLWKILVEEKPHTVINTSPDFLIVTSLYKIIFGCQLVNDVQENHFLNVQSQGYHRGLSKYVALILISLSYLVARPLTDLWIVAEKVYLTQMPWLNAHRVQVMENKFVWPYELPNDIARANVSFESINLTEGTIRLCLSGTFSNLYATLEVLDLVVNLRSANPNLEFVMVGYCPDSSYWSRVQAYIDAKAAVFQGGWFTLIGGIEPVPYHVIIEELTKCDIGIAAYQCHVSFNGKVPTKFYELAALSKPILALNANQFSVERVFAKKGKPYLANNWDILIGVDTKLAKWNYCLANLVL